MGIRDDYSLDMSKLPNQLRVKAGMIQTGEQIAWGSDSALMLEAANKLEIIESELGQANREAEYLAMHLWKKYYKDDSPNFELSDSVAGVISQIDNMCTGLTKASE